MILLVISLYIIGAVLLIADKKNETSRIAAYMAFISGFGGMSAVWADQIVPVFEMQTSISAIYVDKALSSVSHLVSPYIYVLFGLVYSKVASRKRINLFAIGLLIPIVFSVIVYPVKPIDEKLYYKTLSIWTVPYIWTCIILMTYAWLKEEDSILKRRKLFNFIFICPVLAFASFTNFILRIFDVQQAWRINAWIVCIQFIFFIIFAAKYGILGIKLRFEKQSMNTVMKAMYSGSTIMNHAIKNQALAINMCAETIKARSSEPLNQKDVDIILDASNHMLDMISHMQKQLQEIILKKEINNIRLLVFQAISIVSPHIEYKNIKFEFNNFYDKDILCDAIHIKETIINILKNATEALNEDGKILISLVENRKYVVISIKDNGKGIPREVISRVIEPFFSTKHTKTNYGLGLSYCYNVMQKHEGLLEIHSKEGEGTHVTLRFKNRRTK